MSETITETPEAAPVETNNADSTQVLPAPEPSLDDLLAQYDAGTKQEPSGDHDPSGNVGPKDTPAPDDSVDALIASLHADTERANKLEGELASLKSEAHRQQEIAAFDSYSSEIQSRLPETVPPDYAKNALLAAASSDPNLVAAWDTRNVPAAERAQAPALLQQAIQLYQQIQRSPDSDPRKVQALNWIVQRGRYLEAVVHGPGILRKATLDIERKARDFQPLDSEAMQIKADVAFAMKGASTKVLKEPEPNWGQMSSQEYRQEVKR
jgi:hypothetical protein